MKPLGSETNGSASFGSKLRREICLHFFSMTNKLYPFCTAIKLIIGVVYNKSNCLVWARKAAPRISASVHLFVIDATQQCWVIPGSQNVF